MSFVVLGGQYYVAKGSHKHIQKNVSTDGCHFLLNSTFAFNATTTPVPDRYVIEVQVQNLKIFI